MDFNSILSYLQSLLSTKQGQQNNQFGQNLTFQQQALAQKGSEFDKNLALQQEQQRQANEQFTKKLAFDTTGQTAQNLLAQQQQQQAAQQQAYAQKMNFEQMMNNWAASQQPGINAQMARQNQWQQQLAQAEQNRFTKGPMSIINEPTQGQYYGIPVGLPVGIPQRSIANQQIQVPFALPQKQFTSQSPF